MVQAVHTAVPGRARFKVRGLYRSERLKNFLEGTLFHRPEVGYVSASTVTGNLLICFDSDHSFHSIGRLISGLLAEQEAFGDSTDRTAQPENPSSRRGDRVEILTRRTISAVKDRFGRFFYPMRKPKEECWHVLSRDRILKLLEGDGQRGLSYQAVKDRRSRYGPNLLPEPRARSQWRVLLDQFQSLPVGLLGIAAGLSVVTGGLVDAVVIGGVLAVNGLIGFWTERKAEKTIQSLKRFGRPSVEVMREGRRRWIPSEDLVVGDLLILKPGSYVAADARVLEAHHLSIDESTLTGESLPALKSAQALAEENIPISARANMVHAGTLVTGGQGVAVVVATGRYTEMGRLQTLLMETAAPETPIEKQLGRIGDQLVLLCGSVCGLVFVVGFLRGYGLLQMLKMSVSLAAAAVPEGLPAAATTTFALGVRRMQDHHVLIRDLEAVETLGAVQTLCLDKTGTLTWNKMSVLRTHVGMQPLKVQDHRIVSPDGAVDPASREELRRLLQVGVLCSEAQINGEGESREYVVKGSPTESALIELASHCGIDVVDVRQGHPLLQVSHRAETRQYMSTVHRRPESEGRLLAMKGSPREVLEMCRDRLQDGETVPLRSEDRLEIENENDRMAGQALRVLGLAYAVFSDGESPEDAAQRLTWLGLIGMADPIRGGVQEAIRAFHRAGIETVMITGDQSPTAQAIAKKLGLSHGQQMEILDSTELTAIEPETLRALARQVFVYSRVSPAHKLQIVQALQSAGRVVAMTGDGINDGPALKAADVGIAMGRSGTDVAREVADVVLKKDNLETMIIAVSDGRTIHTNVRKSVHFFLSTNFSEIMVMTGALAMGIGFPLNAMQLLWINVISDIFPGLALSLEAPEPDVLETPPRDPEQPIFTPEDYREMTKEAAVISAGALGAYGYGLARYGMGARAGSLAFQSLTVGQLLHAFSCRSQKHTVFDRRQPPRNPYLDAAVGGSLALQLLTTIVPGLRNLLGITAPNLLDAAVIGGSALLSLTVNETTKSGRVAA